MGSNKIMQKRMKIVLGIFVVGVCVLIGSLVRIQIVQHEYYKQKAVNQQTSNTILEPKRGTITDRNGVKLAESISAFDVSIDPKELKRKDFPAEDVARFLADTLEIDYDYVYKQATAQDDKGVYYQHRAIKQKINVEAENAIRKYKTEHKLSCILLTETTKRYYPFGNFASHILGFVGSENQGQSGIEVSFDDELRGDAGRVVSAKKDKTEMPFEYEQYIAAEDGANVVLTIDEVIQHYLEKYLEEAKVNYNLQGKSMGIVMNVETGEILAMANKDDFDPNNPRLIPEVITTEAGALPQDQQQQYKSNYLQSIWRNNVISDGYEPGSVFKMFTAAAALEEGTATLNSSYFCGGSMQVADRKISCWKTAGHGQQTFAGALVNSCNPALMQMVDAMGRDSFYKYQVAFGFKEKTGIELIGEGRSSLHALSNLREVELATSAFGQTFKVTPLQMITAISAIANGGVLYQPYVVKELRDNQGIVTKSYAPVVKRQVVSEETARDITNVLETVVSPKGTGKNAYIKGFRIAGKTGTSEKRDTPDESDRIASFGGFAPADDPQIAVIIILDDPRGLASNGGGAIAAPIFRKVMEDTLNYLNVEPQYTAEEMGEIDVATPDVSGKLVNDAMSILKSNRFSYSVIGNGEAVIEQIPRAGMKMPYGSKVYLYTEAGAQVKKIVVPNLSGTTAAQANKMLTDAGLNVKISGPTDGNAVVTSQSPTAGTEVQVASIISVELISATGIGE